MSTVSAALAAAWAAEGKRVRLAHIADPISCSRPFTVGREDHGEIDIVDLAAPAPWGAADQVLADLLLSQDCPGEIAEEWRRLPGADSWQILSTLAERPPDIDVLVVDLGNLQRAADLLQAATRIPWVLRHLLEAVAGPWGAVDGVAETLLRGLSRVESGATWLTSADSILHVVTSGRALDESKIRKSVPGMLLSGPKPGLLVHISSVDGEDWNSEKWLPLTPVRVAPISLTEEGAFTEPPEKWVAPLLPPISEISIGTQPVGRIVRAPQPARRLRWSMPLIWVQAEDLRLVQRGKDVTLVVHGVPYLLTLPPAARRCEPEVAWVSDGELVVDLTWREGEWREREL